MVAKSFPISQPRQILIVDDHPVIRAGLAGLLRKEPGLEICGQVTDAHEAIEAINRRKPDLVITDISLPGQNGLELIKNLQALHPDLAILVISMHDEMLYAERVLRAGARGYVMKDQGEEKMLQAVQQVLEGEVYVSEKMSAQILQSFAQGRREGGTSLVDCLSDREFEVFQWIGQGRGTRQIAEQLHVSVKTIDAHRANIKDKLNLPNGNALIRFAVRWFETSQIQ